MLLGTAIAAAAACDRAGAMSDAGTGDAAPGDRAADGSAPPAGEPGACGVARTGPVLHVAPDGDDAGDCSAGAPCGTLQRAAEAASAPGSVVRVAPGTYRGFVTVHPDVTFEALGEVVIDGVPEGVPDAVRISGTDRVVVAGFRVRNAERAGIAVLESSDVVLCDNAAGPNGRWGIFTQYAPRVLITDNEAFGSVDEHGIYVSNSWEAGDAPRIADNLVRDNGTNGIQLNGDCQWPGDGTLEQAVIERNRVHGNGAKGLSIIGAPGVVIANNIIHDNGPAAGGIHMTNEPGCPAEVASSGGLVVNNTVVEPEMAAFRATDDATDNVVFNNVFVGPTGVLDQVGGNHIGENLVVDAATGLFGADHALAPGSPARDAGVDQFVGRDAPLDDIDGTARPQGDGIDLGAREAIADDEE